MALLLSLLLSIDSTPKPNETVVFVGDSITQAGDYVADVETYWLACRPNDYFRVINVGKSSETVSGTSEPDHHPPRPCIHDRFARDVAAFKPDIVVACYGMNDGNYFPFDHERFEKYKSGMTRLVKRVFEETPARALVLLTPPPFDASRAPPPPADGKSFGYKQPSSHYDGVLRKYSDWLMTLKSDRVMVVDVHREFHLELRDRGKDSRERTRFSPDGVHPNRDGHWLMARSLLLEWTVRPSWKELALDVQRPQGSLSWSDGKWKWTTPPIASLAERLCSFPLGESPGTRGPLSLEFELFRQTIRIKGLPGFDELWRANLYSLYMPRHINEFSIHSPSLEAEMGRRVGTEPVRFSDLVRKRRSTISAAWLVAQKDKPFSDLKLSLDAMIKAEDDVRSMSKAIDEARKPRTYELVIQKSRG